MSIFEIISAHDLEVSLYMKKKCMLPHDDGLSSVAVGLCTLAVFVSGVLNFFLSGHCAVLIYLAVIHSFQSSVIALVCV